MNCACCGRTVPEKAKSCPNCGAREYLGLPILDPRRPALWIGSVSGLIFWLTMFGDDARSRLWLGPAWAIAGVAAYGLLAWISFPRPKAMTCKHCGGVVASGANRCPHCEKEDYGDADRDNEALLMIGAICGVIVGFIYGLVVAPQGFLAHMQSAIAFGIAGAYIGAVAFLLRLFILLWPLYYIFRVLYFIFQISR